MKTNSTFKHILLALTIMVSVAACKKDKKNDPAPPPVEVKAMTLTALKALSTSATAKVPDNTKISGIVISDVSNKNIDSKTVVLQDATTQSGIIITFDAAQTFALGDQLDVNISGQTLAQVNGEIILQNVPSANAKKTGTGSITAKAATAAEITTNKTAWDGTLVSIASDDLTLTGGNGKYTGTLTITNSTGSLTSNILAGASFENTAYPVSVSSITGIVRTNGTDIRIDIRKTTDVATGAITRVVTEDWTNFTAPIDAIPMDRGIIDIGAASGENFTTATGTWMCKSPGGELYAFMPGSIYDAAFTTSSRSYVYIGIGMQKPGIISSLSNGELQSKFSNLAGLKQVSVTFAGSTMSGAVFPNYGDYLTVAPFNAASNYVQIAVAPTSDLTYPVTGGGSAALDPWATNPAILALVKSSAKYTQTGKFETVTWTVPTKEQLVAAGISSTDADKWLTNPDFSIYNLSTRAPGSFNIIAAPILIDKVVLGF